MMGLDDADGGDFAAAEHSCNIVRVCQRIKVEEPLQSQTGEEIWGLVEFEIYDPDQPIDEIAGGEPKRIKKWKKFTTEAELQDFIRRDTGEPLTLPPYSLTPQQSSKVEEDARLQVNKITEEFRRFRVKSEMARKQSDAQIRDLQSSNVEVAKRRIEEKDVVRTSMNPDIGKSIRAKL